jgi:Tol biopolymer transport system component
MRWCVGLSLCLVIQAVACGPRTASPAEEPRRFPFSIPADRTLRSFAVSVDGRYLAYSAESASDQRLHLYVRPLEGAPSDASLDARPSGDREIAGSTGAHNPFFSPDGSAIAFFSGGAIWKTATGAAAADASPRRITDAPTAAAGGTWADDRRIIFAPLDGEGLMAVPDTGGSPTALTTLNRRNGELEHGWPHALPNGAVLFTVTEGGRDPHLETISIAGERKRQPVPAVGQAQFVSSGHLIYSYLGNLLAIAFDVDKLQTRGVPTAVAKGVQTITGFGNLGRSGFSVSRTGTLVWLPASPEDARSLLVRVDRNGRYSPLPAPPDIYQSPRLSPDGRRLAVVVRPGVMTRDIRVLDASRADRVLLTLSGGDNQSPAWMSDSRRLTFGSNRDGPQKIYVANIGQPSREPRPLFSIDVAAPRNPASWARTRQLLALYEIDPIRRRDVMIYRVDESVTPVAATAANERSPVLSPDGRWIAYVSDASDRDEIYVQRLDAASSSVRLTTTGGIEPVWTREGLFYRSGDRLMLVEWKDAKPSDAKEVLEGVFERDPGANLAAYDVDPKGQFFLMLKSASTPRQLRIITNWGTELARLVPAQR